MGIKKYIASASDYVAKEYKQSAPILSWKSKDSPIIPVDIPTHNLFKLYYWEYRYPRLILEPVLMFICTLGFNTPLSNISFFSLLYY